MMDTTQALDWIGALEFFPGGKDTRHQPAAGRRTSCTTSDSILELKEYYGANGEIETTFGQGRWKAGMRFAVGFNVEDVYLNPEAQLRRLGAARALSRRPLFRRRGSHDGWFPSGSRNDLAGAAQQVLTGARA
ncbi:MAG: hypothetical protein MZW92_39335 [Comamonadaceae bacterium]|nr:hypothetical protein [Comamonadaceae bacterium]